MQGFHGSKYQSVVAPNGLIIDFKGPVGGRHPDSSLWSMSQLEQDVMAWPRYWDQQNHRPIEFALYGDAGYPSTCPRLKTGIPAINDKRTSVEHGFAKVYRMWAYLRWKLAQKVCGSQRLMIHSAVVLTNVLTCLRGSCQISDYFHMPPPTAEDYVGGCLS